MPHITRKLLRKRSEHNEGMITTLEELTLHQEELEGINEVLGATCRMLKILYLQNNLIWKMENLQHLKDLEYINLALNNISKIEGLQNCEFLHKLDLTVNFVDLDELRDSMDHLSSRERLRDLYLMGNPCTSWAGFNSYVIAKIPSLQSLDGTEITRSMQILARQQLPILEAELAPLAEQKRVEKAAKAVEKERERAQKLAEPKGPRSGRSKSGNGSSSSRVQELDENDNVIVDDDEGDSDSEDEAELQRKKDEELTENTPEARTEIYRELAQQKKEKENRDKANQPRERDYEAEQRAALEAVRLKEEESGEREVKQKNEGGWEFRWDEESRPGFIVLEVSVAKHLDSSLIDVDVHPSYVSIVIKAKVLRLRHPAEVRAGESKCQRSKATGHLSVVMPKVNPRENVLISSRAAGSSGSTSGSSSSRLGGASKGAGAGKVAPPRKLTLQEQMMQSALEARQAEAAGAGSGAGVDLSLSTEAGLVGSAVDIRNIVKKPREKEGEDVAEGGAETVFAAAASAGASGGTRSLVEELD